MKTAAPFNLFFYHLKNIFKIRSVVSFINTELCFLFSCLNFKATEQIHIIQQLQHWSRQTALSHNSDSGLSSLASSFFLELTKKSLVSFWCLYSTLTSQPLGPTYEVTLVWKWKSFDKRHTFTTKILVNHRETHNVNGRRTTTTERLKTTSN